MMQHRELRIGKNVIKTNLQRSHGIWSMQIVRLWGAGLSPSAKPSAVKTIAVRKVWAKKVSTAKALACQVAERLRNAHI
jgi:hypothetical protein